LIGLGVKHNCKRYVYHQLHGRFPALTMEKLLGFAGRQRLDTPKLQKELNLLQSFLLPFLCNIGGIFKSRVSFFFSEMEG
jgi:hypothetical protein